MSLLLLSLPISCKISQETQWKHVKFCLFLCKNFAQEARGATINSLSLTSPTSSLYLSLSFPLRSLLFWQLAATKGRLLVWKRRNENEGAINADKATPANIHKTTLCLRVKKGHHSKRALSGEILSDWLSACLSFCLSKEVSRNERLFYTNSARLCYTRLLIPVEVAWFVSFCFVSLRFLCWFCFVLFYFSLFKLAYPANPN